MDLSLLLLATPLMPAVVPAPAPRRADRRHAAKRAASVLRAWRRSLTAPAPRVVPRAGLRSAAALRPACWPAARLPRRACARRASGTKSSFVIGILELLAEEPLLDEHVDVRRVRVGVLALEQPDRVDVLLAAEDQLFFLLALRGVFPDRHGDGHHDGHDAHGDQQRRHRVARCLGCRVLTTLTSWN